MPGPANNLPYFSHPETVLDYARASLSVGLWRSEFTLLSEHVPKEAHILELGTGAGRVAAGMALAGWARLVATDFSPEMIEAAQAVVEQLGVAERVTCEVADATALPYPDGAFDAAVFAFNGLFMIPGEGRREIALREIARVLKPGGIFIFSGHDREATRREHWKRLAELRAQGIGAGEPERMGDTCYDTPRGSVFIHSSDEAELTAELAAAGFGLAFSRMRSSIGAESRATLEFSDDTRMSVAIRRSRSE